MHELSIATRLIDQLLGVAREHDVGRIEEVVVEVGALRSSRDPDGRPTLQALGLTQDGREP